MIFEYTPSTGRERTALAADRLDYGSPETTPQSVVESFPGHITQLRIPGGIYTGNELGLNFDHPALGDRSVRRAMMYALDHAAIANNIHPSTAVPVETPGGDCWDATSYVSPAWIEENLTTYSYDREKAARLMRAAGYTRDGGQWMGPEGEPIELTLATPSDPPRWEPTVASQLSQFGIQTSVKRFSDTTFSNRIDNGEFPIWHQWGNTTNKASSTLIIWLAAAKKPKKYGIYPDDQFETGRFSSEGWPRPRTEERWRVFTVKAPPIGQPDGPLREYHAGALSLLYFTNPPEAEFRRRVKIGMWLANWYLPTIPVNKTLEQHFIDDAHWSWPTETTSWSNFTGGGPRTMAGILAGGAVRTNPANPEESRSGGGGRSPG